VPPGRRRAPGRRYITPSVACGPSRDGAATSADRHACASGHGTRGCAIACASLVDRCVSRSPVARGRQARSRPVYAAPTGSLVFPALCAKRSRAPISSRTPLVYSRVRAVPARPHEC
jgi:hypothetical protein